LLECTQWLRYDATADSGINNQLMTITAKRSRCKLQSFSKCYYFSV